MSDSIVLDVTLNFTKLQKQVRQIKGVMKQSGIDKLTGASTKAPQQIKQTAEQTTALARAFKFLGINANSAGEGIAKIAGKFALWAGISTIIFGIVRAVKALFMGIKELEDSVIKLTRVMEGNATQLIKNVKLTIEFAKEMNILAAVRFRDTIDAMTDATKAGFNFANALKIARSSLIAVNVTELEQAQATRYMIATIRQFNLTANDSLDILDKWNELGKKTGATSLEVAEAVTRSGKAFQAVGGTLSELTGIAAATIEATGESGAKIGTMLKTLSARYADLEKRLSLSNKLNKIGIDIYDEQTGVFEPMLITMAKLSKRWTTLTDEQRSAIGKAAAGIRQYSRFIGIVDNFDSVIRAVAISMNSQGSALTENERRIKSLSFAIGRLGGEFSKLITGPLGTFLLILSKTLVNTATVVVSAFNYIIDIIGKFVDAVSNTQFGKNFRKNFGEDIKWLRDAFKEALRPEGIGMFTESEITSSINQLVDLQKRARLLATEFATTESPSTAQEIGSLFTNADKKLGEMLTNLSGLTQGTNEWDDQLNKIQNRIDSLASPSNQLLIIFKNIRKELGDSKTLRFVKEIFNDALINKTNNEANKILKTFKTFNMEIKNLSKDGLTLDELRSAFKILKKEGLFTLSQFENALAAGLLDPTKDLGKEVSGLIGKFTELLRIDLEITRNVPKRTMDEKELKRQVDSFYKYLLQKQDMIKDINKKWIESLVTGISEGDLFSKLGDTLKSTVENAIIKGIIDGLGTKTVLDGFSNAISSYMGGLFRDAVTYKGDILKEAGPLAGLKDMLAPLLIFGGILGMILGTNNQQQKKEDEQRAEQIKISKESNKHLSIVSRNTTTMAEQLQNFNILSESRYFSLSANRGLTGVA